MHMGGDPGGGERARVVREVGKELRGGGRAGEVRGVRCKILA